MSDSSGDSRPLSDPDVDAIPEEISPEITTLLKSWSSGDAQAGAHLLEKVYRDLRMQAARYLRRERSDITYQPTALVNEVYLKLNDQDRIQWQSRSHFFAISAQLMRRILVDHARARHSQKRGGDQMRVPMELAMDASKVRPKELIALDDALLELAKVDPMKAQLVEMRFFGGLQFQEIAKVLGVSSPTINRHWRVARAWLYRRLNGEMENEDGSSDESSTA